VTSWVIIPFLSMVDPFNSFFLVGQLVTHLAKSYLDKGPGFPLRAPLICLPFSDDVGRLYSLLKGENRQVSHPYFI
jgi:hypothetical protein